MDCWPHKSPMVGDDDGRAEPPQDTRVWWSDIPMIASCDSVAR